NYQNSTTPWTEGGINWDNAPVIGGTPLSAAGRVTLNTWVELDVTPAITGNGIYSFGLKNNSSDRADYSSKESANPPVLLIEMSPASSTSPSIASFTPASGPIGSLVTIIGNNFSSVTNVAFAGNPASSFAVDSNTQLRATVPAGASTGKISVTNSAGTALSANDFTVIQPPAIASFTPTNGPVGMFVTILGSNFLTVTSVAFNGTTVTSFIVDSSTQLRAAVPAGASTGKISVTNSVGTGLSATDFIVTAPPTIASFTPTNGSPGTQVTITGNNFTGVSSVAFNGAAATSFTIDSNTQLRAVVPAAATTGKISVANSAGSGLSANDFTVIAIPAIVSFTPASGPVGTSVTIAGNNFINIAWVAFNGITATNFTVDSATQIRATVPAGASTGKISVANTAGTGSSANDFIVTAIPTIASFSPATGPVGTLVTITGNNLIGVTTVAFNGTSAASFTVDSNIQLRVTVPAAATTGKISVTNSAGTGLSADNFTVTALPAIAAFAPTTGPVGTSVTITGGNFVGVTSVAFNGVAATSFTVDSNTQLRATVPAGANTGKISVTNTAGTAVSANDFILTAAPTISSFTPANGPVGTSVTITGNHFVGTTSAVFNGTVTTSFIIDSNTQLRVTVPPGATTGKIGVTNSAGTGFSTADFVVTANPLITSFTPTSSPVGVEVTISGSNFIGVTSVAFNGTVATSFIVDSNVRLRVMVPQNATTGKIGVTNSAGTTLSANTFTVTGSILTFYPVDDAEVKSSSPTTNFGTNTIFRLRDGSIKYNSYLKFFLTGLSAPVHRAKLRLYVNEGSDDGGALYLVSNTFAGSSTPWNERSIVWNNAPVIDGVPLHRVNGAVSANTWVEMEVTAAITGDGVYSFGMVNSSTTSVKYCAKQGTNPPELVVEMASSTAPIISSFMPTAGTPGTVVTVVG
ncbi:MAG: IPT/TIG domain-containing protein, partial [candidate division KSB1 bacterium]|nr:IPT/TIG domain-containing protein [candidate division KSB1 bacterium]